MSDLQPVLCPCHQLSRRLTPPAVPTPQATALLGAAAVSPAAPAYPHKEKARGLNLGKKKADSLNAAKSVSAPACRPRTHGVPAAP